MSSDALPASSDRDVLLDVRNVTKTYRTYEKPIDRLLQFFSKRDRSRQFTALRDVSFTLGRGEAVGILGANGAGKSTLLQIVAGIMEPTEGEVITNGRISALLELGSGFNPDYTGRENVFLNGAILGIPRAEMERRFDEIAAFANIGEFIEQPVKQYSSGMYVRLAFAVAISVSPEILIVDEALAVGDVRFQQRCAARIRELREAGVTILLVTHDTEAVRRICGHAIVLEKGRVVREGHPDNICNWYLAHMVGEAVEEEEIVETGEFVAPREFKWLRHGDGKAKIIRSVLLDEDQNEVESVLRGDWATFEFDVQAEDSIPKFILGFYLRDRLGTDIIGANTFQENVEVPAVEPGDVVRFRFRMRIQFRPGAYGVSPGLAYDQHVPQFLDFINNAMVIEVRDPEPTRTVFGIFHPDLEVDVALQPRERRASR